MRRAVVWVRDGLDEVREKLLDRAARARVLVPTPNGTFVVGPNPVDDRTLAESIRVIDGGVGLEWTDAGVVVRGAEYLDGQGDDAKALFRDADLFAEAELVTWLDQGGADAATPAVPRDWRDGWLSRYAGRRGGYVRSRGVVVEFAMRVVILALMAAFVLSPMSEVFAGSVFQWLLLGGVGLGGLALIADCLFLPLVARRWRQQLPVIDPLGLLASRPSDPAL